MANRYCLPLALGSMIAIAALTPSNTTLRPSYYPVSRAIYDSPRVRRPLPIGPIPIYYQRGLPPGGARQGTAFGIDGNGNWGTAAHVTDGCATLRFMVSQRLSAPTGEAAAALGEDISIVGHGPFAAPYLGFSRQKQRVGTIGYHMGYPLGRPGVVGSRLLGTTSAVRHADQREDVLVWVEDWRTEPTEDLDGLSGGPVLNDRGEVVGLVSMASERRGRILTAKPTAIRRWLVAGGSLSEKPYATAIADKKAAVFQLQYLINHGVIRQLYCDI